MKVIPASFFIIGVWDLVTLYEQESYKTMIDHRWWQDKLEVWRKSWSLYRCLGPKAKPASLSELTLRRCTTTTGWLDFLTKIISCCTTITGSRSRCSTAASRQQETGCSHIITTTWDVFTRSGLVMCKVTAVSVWQTLQDWTWHCFAFTGDAETEFGNLLFQECTGQVKVK